MRSSPGSGVPRSDTGSLLEHLFRHQAGRLVARLTRLFGPAYVGLAEETVQEAMLRAFQTWPYHGVPENAPAWLYRVAHNLAIDAVRRERAFGGKCETLIAELTRSASRPSDDIELEEQLRDDELRMIFMCCHPEISPDAAVALSLKTVGGFSVREIARAFLADEPTIAQRLVRSKRHIRDRGLTLDLPDAAELAARLDSVLAVIYLMFNEGYAAHEGTDLIRQDLCLEALRLGRLVAGSSINQPGDLVPPAPLSRSLAGTPRAPLRSRGPSSWLGRDAPRVHALVALMALQSARLPARVDGSGDLVLFDDQDRARWDDRFISLGFRHFDLSMAGTDVSEYHVQAAIAATHARAIDPEFADWRLILQFYDQLFALNPSPVVALNRAVAVAKVHGPAEGLAAIEPLEHDPKLRQYHLLLSVRGRLLSDLGRTAEAADCFRGALECACSEPERRFLKRTLEDLER